MAQAVSQISLDKLPPFNLEAEQSVIGACFKAEDALSKALEVLSEEDFYKASHRTIFRNMRALFEINHPTHRVVQQFLRRRGPGGDARCEGSRQHATC